MDAKSTKDVSHSNLEELDTEDLYVKLKVNITKNFVYSEHNLNLIESLFMSKIEIAKNIGIFRSSRRIY